MKNKSHLVVYFVVIVIFIVGFIKMKESGAATSSLAAQRAHEKVVFDENQEIYNDDSQKEIRSQRMIEKQVKAEAQANNNVEEIQRNGEGQFKMKF